MIPFSPPHIDQKIIDEVNDTLQSGWITTGPKTKLFEKKLSEYNGNPVTLCVSSATAGLEIILRWFGIGEGDEVILPAYTYCATANVITHTGAKPVFVDINDDFNISIEEIKKHITEKTKAIMPVDISGWPCDYNEIYNLVNKTELKKKFNPTTKEQEDLGRILILSDSAHSIGAEYNGKKTGSLADCSVFSFHAVKNLTTAEGGAIALNLPEPFNNQELYNKLNILILHGQNKDALAKTQKGNWKYDIVDAGYKANMTDIQASIGLVELDRYESNTLVKRRKIFDKYTSAFEKYDWAEIPFFDNEEKTSSFHLYLLRIKDITEEQRDEIIQRIFDKDVSVNVHFKPVPMFTYYKGQGYDIKNYPNSYKNFAKVITLPVYYTLTDEQLDIIINAVVNSVKEVIDA